MCGIWSAAHVHITDNRSDFETFIGEPHPPLELQLHDEYLSPGIHYKLISLRTIEAQVFRIEAFNGQINVLDSATHEIYLIGSRDRTSYTLGLVAPIEKISCEKVYLGTALRSYHTPPLESCTHWHRRLEHLNI